MSPRVIFHVGSGKTGTSYLQSCFSLSESTFLANGLYYPRAPRHDLAVSGRITGGNGLRIARTLNPNTFTGTPDESLGDDLLTAIAHAEGREILFSSEAMMSMLGPQLSTLVDTVRSHGYSVLFVMYVRSLVELAYSSYNMHVKRANLSGDFGDFLATFSPSFVRVAREFATRLDPSEFVIRNYDKVKTGLAADFRYAAGIRATLSSPPNKTVNRSLDSHELAVMRELNRLMPNSKMPALVGDALVYNDPDRACSYDITEEDVRIVSGRFGTDLDFVNQLLPDEHRVTVSAMTSSEYTRTRTELTPSERNLVAILAHLLSSDRSNTVAALLRKIPARADS
ncbi:hypothetical protein ACUN0C_16830 [Faunimonas sp. B44]|uniref:hypothetical protein n=1 Tax=Faunimonas sp. B44 TaxID=3461493 RepID=UPI004043B109